MRRLFLRAEDEEGREWFKQGEPLVALGPLGAAPERQRCPGGSAARVRYRVVVTTDGREGMLERTLAALDRLVRPRPAEGVIVDDSGDASYRLYLEAVVNERGWRLVYHPMRLGFCRTVADAWTLAAAPGPDWVLWMEDDMEIVRPVALVDLAYVLERQPQVAQMALYRNAVSPEEIAAGGYVQLRPETYARRGDGAVSWLEHRNFWTTNPSLFPREIAVQHRWPGEINACEGHFGFILRGARPGTTFGLWGAGADPHVRHIGERGGHGY